MLASNLMIFNNILWILFLDGWSGVGGAGSTGSTSNLDLH
jgi:hypothetical protein